MGIFPLGEVDGDPSSQSVSSFSATNRPCRLQLKTCFLGLWICPTALFNPSMPLILPHPSFHAYQPLKYTAQSREGEDGVCLLPLSALEETVLLDCVLAILLQSIKGCVELPSTVPLRGWKWGSRASSYGLEIPPSSPPPPPHTQWGREGERRNKNIRT